MYGQSSIMVMNIEEMCLFFLVFFFYAKLQKGNRGEGRPGKNETVVTGKIKKKQKCGDWAQQERQM